MKTETLTTSEKLAIYVHWPFCMSKCPYCDFNSHVANSLDVDDFIKGYLLQLEQWHDILAGKHIESVYFGGGTPSLAPVRFFDIVLNKLAQLAHLASDTEITMEANPSSSEAAKFEQIRLAGVNRVSLGVQSFNDKQLRFLGRAHSANEAYTAIEATAKTFPRYSFDLIYALPEQSLSSWEEALSQALQLANGHISLYQLTIEKGTPFYKAHKDGQFQLPDPEQAALMYEATEAITSNAGYSAYEVSNYAMPGAQSRHNLAYWHYRDYLGIGPGAHSRLTIGNSKQAIVMWHNPGKWREMVAVGTREAIQEQQILSQEAQYEERIMMGLRVSNGIALEGLKNLDVVQDMVAQGLLNIAEAPDIDGVYKRMLRPTLKGRLVLNYITGKILA
ncbi:MAG: coproporphyrinogen III oxidase [Proteobacteria bacterium]|nr:coproporphyrinogen III oxidase [Pseudomonadota bacterium]